MRYVILFLLALPVLAADDPVPMVPLAEAEAFFREMDKKQVMELRERDAVIRELARKLSNVQARECV